MPRLGCWWKRAPADSKVLSALQRCSQLRGSMRQVMCSQRHHGCAPSDENRVRTENPKFSSKQFNLVVRAVHSVSVLWPWQECTKARAKRLLLLGEKPEIIEVNSTSRKLQEAGLVELPHKPRLTPRARVLNKLPPVPKAAPSAVPIEAPPQLTPKLPLPQLSCHKPAFRLHVNWVGTSSIASPISNCLSAQPGIRLRRGIAIGV